MLLTRINVLNNSVLCSVLTLTARCVRLIVTTRRKTILMTVELPTRL